MKKLLLILWFSFSSCIYSYDWIEPDWSENAKITPGKNRGNIYQLPQDQYLEAIKKGQVHALKWPVEITGLIVPYEPLRYFLEEEKSSGIHKLIEKIAKSKMGYMSLDGMYEWLGLNIYPESSQFLNSGVFQIPYPEGIYPEYRMGVSLIDTPHGKGLTFSCATCHSGTFLGKSIMGLTNKRSRANEFFWLAKKYIPYVGVNIFQKSTKATDGEAQIFKRTKKRLRFVNTRKPQVLGLDTASAHVALSLARRADDEYASLDPKAAFFPKPHRLEHFVADSKPMPWWNLKYKTRWLSDGSITSGNPILMNILWNELGRGTDLKELESWVKNNEDKVRELTTAVFSNKAPGWLEFFPRSTIDLSSAKRGEKVFNNHCMKCHGRYEKGWSHLSEVKADLSQLIKTTKTYYHPKTPVVHVGTDPNRYSGTKELAESLNKMKISKTMGIKMNLEQGYVPPPLEGIFLRYPYMHNNSIPNLCALMEHPSKRPMRWVQGPSLERTDYDANCMGYPVGSKIPWKWWQDKEAIFDASKSGLKNIGHSSMFWNADGSEIISSDQKKDLREFLKTL